MQIINSWRVRLGQELATFRQVPVNEQIARILVMVCAVAAFLALTVIAIRAALRIEIRWDTFMYHIPFAAIYGGLDVPYDMNDRMQELFRSFPPLPHLVEGMLWRLTGSLNATGVANFLAFAAFLVHCHVNLKARWWLVALVSLTAPLVVIHAAVSYVDLFGNSLLAIGVTTCLFLYLFPEKASRTALICGLLGLVGAAWSKFQLTPIIALFLMLYAVLGWRMTFDAMRMERRRFFAIVGIATVLVSLPYLKNLVLFGNPFWPLRVPLIGDLLPYTVDHQVGALTQRPRPLADYSQFRLFIHSLFEINHPVSYPDRPRWIIDQGNAWIAFRMGGFWFVEVIFYLLTTAAMLVVYNWKRGLIASLSILGLLCFVAILPQSHELRYYLFLPLSWAGAVGMLYPQFKEELPKVSLAFLAAVLGLFGYMVSENRVHYRIEKTGYAEAAQLWGAASWWSKLERGRTYCAVDMMPIGIMLTGPTMREFAIVDRSRRDLCPAGSTVITNEASFLGESLALYQSGQFEASIAAARKVLVNNPDSADAYNNICAAHNALKQWDKAIAACTKAITLKPDYPLARNNLAWAKKEIANAKDDARRTLAAAPLLNQSFALYQEGKFEASIEVARKALALKPDYAEAYSNICAAHNSLKQWNKAIEACTKAIELKPDFQLAKNNLAWAQKMAKSP